MTDTPNPIYLLTPGPLTTSSSVKEAMLHDWGSRDAAFIATNRDVCSRLTRLANAEGSHTCVPLQGSGTFIIEATIGTLLERGSGKLLVLSNGAYGRRMAQICQYLDIDCVELGGPENAPNDTGRLARALEKDAAITHVAVVHCETTSGVLNPLEAVARVVAAAGRRLIVDAMSTFGALPIDAASIRFDALVASSNKCLEGVPGMGFALIARPALEASQGNARSLALDLHAQWSAMERDGQWRFTPPTQVIGALHQALNELDAEGGPAGRAKRYRDNCETLIRGMRALGFEPLLSAGVQAPIIVTFHTPADPAFDFDTFYARMNARGFVIYPGKLTAVETFRLGCIGRLDPTVMHNAVRAAQQCLTSMGVFDARPAEHVLAPAGI